MSDSEKSIQALIKEYHLTPIRPLELADIVEQLRDPSTSIQSLTRYFYRDPMLCGYLLQTAWQQAKNKENAPFAADHALSSLGMERVSQFFKSWQSNTKRAEPARPISDEVKFMMSSAVLAAELMRQLTENSPKLKSLYWAALNHNFADTLLWSLKPRPMWRIQYRQLVLPKKIPLFEQAKLGFDLCQWRIAIGKEWHLSELNQITYAKQFPFSRKELLHYGEHGYSNQTATLKSWHLTDSWLIVTVNWLAKCILASWFKNSYKHYIGITQQAFRVSSKKLQQAVQGAIRESSEHLKQSQLFIPAERHLQLSGSSVYPQWLNAAPKVPARRDSKYLQQTAQLKQKADLIAAEKFIHEIRSKPKQFRNTNVLLRQVMDLMIEKIGCSRASLLVVDWKNKKVSTSMFVRQNNCEKIKLAFDFASKTPLVKFVAEQGFMFFDKNKHGKIWNRLPQEIITQNIDQFIFFSFKPAQRVDFLIYVDNANQDAINQERLKTTKQLLSTTNKVISYNTSKT